ncbi:hypothetical protein V8068_001184 [Vibrio parahaemolyticus]|nr:hypothetical protein [Vibrio parahaemolyticus]
MESSTSMVGTIESKKVTGMSQAQQIMALLNDVLIGSGMIRDHANQIRSQLVGEIATETGENGLCGTPLPSDSLLPFIIEKLNEIKSVQTYTLEQNEIVVRSIEVAR